MRGPFRRLVAHLSLAVFGCAAPTAASVHETLALRQTDDFCPIAVAALDVAIKPFTEGSLAMELACVKEYGAHDGKIYVDARFTAGNELVGTTAPTCVTDRYAVRFDPYHFQPSPAPAVVLLAFTRHPDGSWDFGVSMERPDWPRRRPETMSLSECYSSFGLVRPTPAGWKAEVVPPPRSPDAL